MAEGVNKGGIYGLEVDGTIIYIGQAKNIARRFSQHCSIAQNRGATSINKRLYELLSEGIAPKLVIVELTEDLDSREVFWISHYRLVNDNLLNMADGGRSYSYAERSKENNPWGKGWSPVRRRLNLMQSNIRTFKRLGRHDMAARAEAQLKQVNEYIKVVGLKRMNQLLWSKYEQ
jgi:predicted GIY-YIG superfamily endonuclease